MSTTRAVAYILLSVWDVVMDTYKVCSYVVLSTSNIVSVHEHQMHEELKSVVEKWQFVQMWKAWIKTA